MWLVGLQQFFRSGANRFYDNWLPTYLQEARKCSKEWAANLSSWPQYAGVIGGIVGGLLSDWVLQRTGSRRAGRQWVAIGSLLVGSVFYVAAFYTGDVAGAMLLMSAGYFITTFAAPCAYSLTMDLGGRNLGVVFATMNMAGNLGSFAFTWAVPRLNKLGGWDATLYVFAAAHVVSAVCWLLLNPNGTIGEPGRVGAGVTPPGADATGLARLGKPLETRRENHESHLLCNPGGIAGRRRARRSQARRQDDRGLPQSSDQGTNARFLDGAKTRAEWEAKLPRLRQEYFDMLGLWPLPEKTPLKATVTGTLEHAGVVIEKLHFQSRPGLYVTGNLYRPKESGAAKLPAILYVCGHANRGRDGNKTAFQDHGIWFANNGYVCLIIDSLQLGEIAGKHHGTYNLGRWWWQSAGYTPAGVECWNGVRAIDYLVSRPDVDADRIGVTGISGGGAATFWIGAADERVKVAVPVSGMSDLESYVTNKVINGHCDCMFLYNTYGWEWTTIAALIAPRPMLFANSDNDRIFPMDGNRRIIERLRKAYKMYEQAGPGRRVRQQGRPRLSAGFAHRDFQAGSTST